MTNKHRWEFWAAQTKEKVKGSKEVKYHEVTKVTVFAEDYKTALKRAKRLFKAPIYFLAEIID